MRRTRRVRPEDARCQQEGRDELTTVILCGGMGTRLRERTHSIPKPMVEIGGQPILWHILKTYEAQGFRRFVLCLGYLGEVIRSWVAAAPELGSLDIACVDTGADTPTGGRIFRVADCIKEREFFVTYGDGLANVDLRALLRFHRSHGRLATLTAIRPRLPFGLLELTKSNAVTGFHEKPQLDHWINGGFFVFGREVFGYLDADTPLEGRPLETLARERQLMAYIHGGFWACMDTYKDERELNELWASGRAEWQWRG